MISFAGFKQCACRIFLLTGERLESNEGGSDVYS